MARKKWKQIPFELLPGHVYRFEVPGHWHDLHIKADATGFDSVLLKPIEARRRFPSGKWFSLIGALDEVKRNLFDIKKLGAINSAIKFF